MLVVGGRAATTGHNRKVGFARSEFHGISWHRSLDKSWICSNYMERYIKMVSRQVEISRNRTINRIRRLEWSHCIYGPFAKTNVFKCSKLTWWNTTANWWLWNRCVNLPSHLISLNPCFLQVRHQRSRPRLNGSLCVDPNVKIIESARNLSLPFLENGNVNLVVSGEHHLARFSLGSVYWGAFWLCS